MTQLTYLRKYFGTIRLGQTLNLDLVTRSKDSVGHVRVQIPLPRSIYFFLRKILVNLELLHVVKIKHSFFIRSVFLSVVLIFIQCLQH